MAVLEEGYRLAGLDEDRLAALLGARDQVLAARHARELAGAEEVGVDEQDVPVAERGGELGVELLEVLDARVLS